MGTQPKDGADLELSVLVVSFNTRELTLACLESLYHETAANFETIVVDNASQDGSAEAIASRFPQAKLIPLEDNIGFAAGNNLAAEHVRSPRILLLNPDTVVLNKAVDKLLAFADTKGDRYICGGRTLFEDGNLNPSSCWGRITPWSTFCEFSGLSSVFRRSRLFDPESLGPWPRDSARAVDIVSGCFFLVPTLLWRELEGFDRDFFMYGEEADFCHRASNRGVQPWLTPTAEIIHLGGASERVRADKLVRLLGARARLIRRHWHPLLAPWGVRMVAGRAATRSLFWKIRSFLSPAAARSESAACWMEVWKRRGEWISDAAR